MKNKNRIIAVVFVFLLLLILDIVLGAGIFLTVFFNKTKSLKDTVSFADLAIMQNASDSLDILDTLDNTNNPLFISTGGAVLEKSELKVKITNASGISGAASILKDQIEKQSEQIEEIFLANAEESSLTLVKIKKNVAIEIEELILKTVQTDYPQAKKEILDDSFLEDVIIILGKREE